MGEGFAPLTSVPHAQGLHTRKKTLNLPPCKVPKFSREVIAQEQIQLAGGERVKISPTLYAAKLLVNQKSKVLGQVDAKKSGVGIGGEVITEGKTLIGLAQELKNAIHENHVSNLIEAAN